MSRPASFSHVTSQRFSSVYPHADTHTRTHTSPARGVAPSAPQDHVCGRRPAMEANCCVHHRPTRPALGLQSAGAYGAPIGGGGGVSDPAAGCRRRQGRCDVTPRSIWPSGPSAGSASARGRRRTGKQTTHTELDGAGPDVGMQILTIIIHIASGCRIQETAPAASPKSSRWSRENRVLYHCQPETQTGPLPPPPPQKKKSGQC